MLKTIYICGGIRRLLYLSFLNGNRKEGEREERERRKKRKRSEKWQAIERAICEQH